MTTYGPVIHTPDLRCVAGALAAGVSVLESNHEVLYFIGSDEGTGFVGELLRRIGFVHISGSKVTVYVARGASERDRLRCVHAAAYGRKWVEARPSSPCSTRAHGECRMYMVCAPIDDDEVSLEAFEAVHEGVSSSVEASHEHAGTVDLPSRERA